MQAAIDAHAAAKPKTGPPQQRLLNRYCRLVREEYDHQVAVGRKEVAQVKRALKNHTEDELDTLLTWVFEHWPALRAANAKLYDLDEYPPLRVLVTASISNRYLPHALAGRVPGQRDDSWTGDERGWTWWDAVRETDHLRVEARERQRANPPPELEGLV